MSKLVVLGLDGLDLSLINYLGFKKTSGSLLVNHDPLVPLTYPSWSSILTGVNPGKHGLIDFFDYYKTDNRWKAVLLDASRLEYPRIHELLELSSRSKYIKSIMINPIPSSPIYPLRHVQIVSYAFFTPRLEIIPYKKQYAEMCENIRKVEVEMYEVAKENECRILCDVTKEYIDKQYQLFSEIIDQYDFVWMNIDLPDKFLHLCSTGLSKDFVLTKSILEKLGRIVNKALENSENVIIVSDHGFKLYKEAVNVNRILYLNKLIVKGKGGYLDHLWLSKHREKSDRISIPLTLYKFAKFLFRGKLREFIRNYLYRKGKYVEFDPGIDVYNSKAFSPVTRKSEIPPRYVVLLNDLSVRDKVVKVLRDYGLEAYWSGEIYRGDFVNPRIVYVYGKGDKHPFPGTIYSDITKSIEFAQHNRYGVVYAYLEDHKPAYVPKLVPNTIIAPLVLGILGVDVDRDMEAVDLVRKIYPALDLKHSRISYRGKWRIMKNIYKLKYSSR